MKLSDREILLADRIVLHNEVHDSFIKNMKTRLDFGINKMELNNVSIEPVYCSTINKHTCMEMLNGHPSKYFLILDEHHLELLSSMNLLFYMFGQNDFKEQLLWLAMTETMETPAKRLKAAASILLSEKSLLEGNATRALTFLDVYEKNKCVVEWGSGVEAKADLNWFLLKDPMVTIAHGLIMNYYVFHELAQIKIHCDKETLSVYKSFIKPTLESMHLPDKYEPYISVLPNDDIACDAYALDLLFDFMYEQSNDYQFEYMVDSFISAVTNLTIMDSVISHGDHIEDRYVICWFRVIMALNLVGYLKEVRDCNIGFLSNIHSCMTDGYVRFKNYKKRITNAINELTDCYGAIPERHSLLNSEWKAEMARACRIIASIS